MTEKTKIDPILEQKINEIYQVETRYAIILAIMNFGPMNIQKIADLLGKNKSTIYYHIKEMTKDPPLLVLAEKETHSQKGIFYKIAIEIEHIFSNPSSEAYDKISDFFETLLQKPEEEIKEFYLNVLLQTPEFKQAADSERKKILYNHFIENYILKNFKKSVIEIDKGKKSTHEYFPLTSIINMNMEMKVYNLKQYFKIIYEANKFFKNLDSLNKEYQKELKENSIKPENVIDVHFHLVGGEVKELNFK